MERCRSEGQKFQPLKEVQRLEAEEEGIPVCFYLTDNISHVYFQCILESVSF